MAIEDSILHSGTEIIYDGIKVIDGSVINLSTKTTVIDLSTNLNSTDNTENPDTIDPNSIDTIDIDDQVIELPQGPVTMTDLIKMCMANKPKDVIIDTDYPDLKKCHRLLRLLTEGKNQLCLSLWSNLKPEYDIEEQIIYFKTKNIKKQGPIGFRAEIEVFGFPQTINNEAQKIHQSLDRIIKKGAHRIELFFYCLYYAHKSMRIAILPESIADRVGLPISSMPKSLNIANPIHYNMKAPTQLFTYTDYIKVLLEEDFALDARLCKVVRLPIKNLLKMQPLLINEYKPQRLALASVIYFHNSYGIKPPTPSPRCLSHYNNKDIIRLIKLLESHDRP